MDAMLAESAARIVRELGDDGAGLWAAFEANGFAAACLPEEQGGFGLAPADGLALVRIAAHAQADTPLADTILAGLKPNANAGEADALGAVIRSAQCCGAMEAVLEISLAYAAEREQFGRSLDKFQAIQAHLTTIAAELAAASAATEAAVAGIGPDGACDVRLAAIAKVRTGEAAGLVAAAAHQVHGAIGYTDEYRLAAHTRRLWQWREDFGNEHYWAAELGRLFIADDRHDVLDRLLGEVDG